MSDEKLSLLRPDAVRQRLGALAADEPVIKLGKPAHITSDVPLSDAGVLIPLSEHEQQMHVLLTRRAEALRKHSGEISFPGGRRDLEDDGLLATALRETWEEVALEPEQVSVFGHFSRMPTPSGFMIWSYVGEFSHGVTLRHNPSEIDYMLQIPLAELIAPGVHQTVMRDFQGVSYPIHYFHYGEQPIWGATAYMLYELLRYLGVMERAKLQR